MRNQPCGSFYKRFYIIYLAQRVPVVENTAPYFVDEQLLRIHRRRRTVGSHQTVHRKSKEIGKEETATITVQVKLLPTAEQESYLRKTTMEYIAAVNGLSRYIAEQPIMPRLSSATFSAELPSSVKSEVTRVAKSVFMKYKRGKCPTLPVLRKPVATWNNQNYRITDDCITFPVLINGKCRRITVKAIFTGYQVQRLNSRLGALRITQKNSKWIAQIAVDTPEAEPTGDVVMGVDLGLKVPAVAVTDAGKTKFFGNGRQYKYMKRKFRAKRKTLGKAKKLKAIKKLNNKEQRWMRNQDHKVSRSIARFAQDNNVSAIHLEQLQNIRNTARTSRKNEKNLHTWSFYRLAMYITYKAALLGIKVVFVNPAYTSQTCPVCGKINHVKDRKYLCQCGFISHRDRVGAMNIISAPVVSGNRNPA